MATYEDGGFGILEYLARRGTARRVIRRAGCMTFIEFRTALCGVLRLAYNVAPVTLRQKVAKALNRTVGPLLPAGLLAKRYPGIPGRIHMDDQMLISERPEHLRHYIEDAQSAIWNIQQSLAAVGRSFADIEACLDFACGYGRVTRLLATELLPYKVTAYDTDRQAVRFCASEFGVRPLPARSRDPALKPHAYDLIFVGSLFTHLRWVGCLDVLEQLVGALRRGGLLIFSTQGATCLAHLDWYGPEFIEAASEFSAEVERTGIHFVPYRRVGKPDYGITIHAKWFIEKAMAEQFMNTTTFVRFEERGWDRHQDVWTYQRA